MTHVTVLGLGIMGSGIAHNILKAGYPLTVYNRTKEKAAPLIEAGAQWANSPALAAEHAEVVISMVGDDEASRAMWLGESGAFAAMPPHTVAVECSTLSLDWIRDWRAVRIPRRESDRVAGGGQQIGRRIGHTHLVCRRRNGNAGKTPAGPLSLFNEHFTLARPARRTLQPDQQPAGGDPSAGSERGRGPCGTRRAPTWTRFWRR